VRVEDDRSRFAAVWGLWLVTGQGAAHGVRVALADELFRLAERLDDPALRLQAHHAAWATVIWRGEFAASRKHIRQGLALYDRVEHRNHALLYGGHDPAVCGTGQGAMALWLLGHPDQAADSAREAIELSDDLAHVPSIGHARWFAGVTHLVRRDSPAVLDCGEQLVALGREHGLAQYRAIGEILRGWARVQLGDAAAGLDELREGIRAYGEMAKVMLGFFSTALAEAELHAGYTDKAEAALAAAKRETELRDEIFWRPGILRVEGDLLLACPPTDVAAAEQCYREAMTMARANAGLALELRAALGLARLWCRQDRRDETRTLLVPLYGRFSEGLDTLDLVEVKALLDQLG
jgi:predicted ATPase